MSYMDFDFKFVCDLSLMGFLPLWIFVAECSVIGFVKLALLDHLHFRHVLLLSFDRTVNECLMLLLTLY